MKELKITVDQLKNYLGTGLNLKMRSATDVDHGVDALIGISEYMNNEDEVFVRDSHNRPTEYKLKFAIPICYRLSDLDKEIEHKGERFVPLDMLNKRSTALTLYRMETENKTCLVFDTAVHGYNVLSSFNKVQQLFEWHFWPFGDEYFEQGLVIDKMKHNNG